MSAAAEVVKRGGLIVCAAECCDGSPSHGSFRDELTSASSPQALLAAIESREQTVPDQGEAQIQAKIQARARIVMQTSFLSDDELAGAHLEQTQDIAETVTTALQDADAGECSITLALG